MPGQFIYFALKQIVRVKIKQVLMHYPRRFSGKSDKSCRMRRKKGVQNSLPGFLLFFTPLSFSLLSSLIGAPCIFFYRLLHFLLRAFAQGLSVDILLFFFYISFSFFSFLRTLLVVLFGRAKECAALGLITPSRGTEGERGGELRLRNSLWPDFWNS